MPNPTPAPPEDPNPVRSFQRNAHLRRRAHRRYRRARLLLTILGAVIAVVGIGVWLALLDPGQAALSRGQKLMVLAVLGAGALGPWLLVEMLWQRKLRRNYWEWQ